MASYRLQNVRPRQVPSGAGLDHSSLYFNQELSWLDFNWRVFHQARDPRLPILERVRFLGITASNLDEFVQTRVGGLLRQQAAHVWQPSSDGRRPQQILSLVRSAAREMSRAIAEVWNDQLKPLLMEETEIRILGYDALEGPEVEALAQHFRARLYPILTPLAVDPGHPFPFISNLSLSLAIEMREPRSASLHFARVKVPVSEGRWHPVPGGDSPYRFIALEEVVRRNVGELFRGMEIVHVHAFRVTRNADIEREEEEAEDLIAMISDELRERRLAPVVRLEVEKAMPEHVRALLLKELEIGPEDLVEVSGELALGDCLELAGLDLPEHQIERWEPVVPRRFLVAEAEGIRERDIFSVIREGDVLVHHPYESFTATVQRLVEQAAEDPAVLAIKQTLYRTSEQSPIVEALLRAADRGKQVAVMVEVKARFDEQNNIEWARILETAGIHVTYGVLGLKTHAKLLLIVREENEQPRAYCHIGTGNYHTRNARVYTDLGLLTCNPAIASDVVNLFHSLTGYAPDQRYDRLVIAPGAMRERFHQLIDREIAAAREGREAQIVGKMNALDDPRIIRQLYEASRAGVRVDLIIRGHCCLRPGLPGYSENIRVVSLIGRFLEHDRIYMFWNRGEPELYIGSADWRSRNLDTRVEAIVPIDGLELKARLMHILQTALSDNQLSWELNAGGRYVRRSPAAGETAVDLHRALMEDTLRRREGAEPTSADGGRRTRPRVQGKARSLVT
jgi:polyphosphate kinase